MDFETIILKKEAQIATITLNRPEKLNALGGVVLVEFGAALEDVAKDDDVRVVIVTGAGRAFCAGGDFDFSEIRKGIMPVLGRERLLQYLGRGRLQEQPNVKVMLDLQRLEKPTIAMVNGDAIGGGFDIALGCDIRVGSDRARFAVGYTRVGAVPAMGGTWFLPRLVGLGKALELILTSDLCSAEEAYRLGILNKLVPHEELESETMELASKLAKAPPISQRLAKMLTYKTLEVDLETALMFTSGCNFIAETSEDHIEAVKAFAEKRAPVFGDR